MSTRSYRNQRSQKAKMRDALQIIEAGLGSLIAARFEGATCGFSISLMTAWQHMARRALGHLVEPRECICPSWDDAGEIHADCANPFSLSVERQPDIPEPVVLLGSPMRHYPLAALARSDSARVETDDEAFSDAWNDFAGMHLEDGNDGHREASVYRACRAAFDGARSQGHVAARAAAVAALPENARPNASGGGERDGWVPLVFYDASDPARRITDLAEAFKRGNGRASVVGWQRLIADLNTTLAQPATREDALREAAQALLDEIDADTCLHECLVRGGTIWTICDECGEKWADDRGGFTPHTDSETVANLRAALDSAKAGA